MEARLFDLYDGQGKKMNFTNQTILALLHERETQSLILVTNTQGLSASTTVCLFKRKKLRLKKKISHSSSSVSETTYKGALCMAMHDLRLIAFDVKRGLSSINSQSVMTRAKVSKFYGMGRYMLCGEAQGWLEVCSPDVGWTITKSVQVYRGRELITNISRPLSRSFPVELVIATSRGESLVTV